MQAVTRSHSPTEKGHKEETLPRTDIQRGKIREVYRSANPVLILDRRFKTTVRKRHRSGMAFFFFNIAFLQFRNGFHFTENILRKTGHFDAGACGSGNEILLIDRVECGKIIDVA